MYCRRDEAWKIADFGLTVSGTSKQSKTTHYSRGTASYRAPELLRTKATFTNKVDIWALGCILYEAVFGTKLFKQDYHVLRYTDAWRSFSRKVHIPQISHSVPYGCRMLISESIHDMLEVDPAMRPRAEEVHRKFLHLVVGTTHGISNAASDLYMQPDFNKKVCNTITMVTMQRWHFWSTLIFNGLRSKRNGTRFRVPFSLAVAQSSIQVRLNTCDW